MLVKTSGKLLSIGQVVAANSPDLIDEGFDRAVDAAEAIGRLVGRPVEITAAVEEPSPEAAAEPAGQPAEGPVGDATEGPALPARPGSEAEGSPPA